MAMAASGVLFVAVVVDEVLDDEFVYGVCGLAGQADGVGAGAGVFEFVEELVDVVFFGEDH